MITSIDKVQPVHMPLNICGSKHKATSEKTRVPTPDLKAEGVDLSLFVLCSCYPSAWFKMDIELLNTTWGVRLISRDERSICTREKSLECHDGKCAVSHYRNRSNYNIIGDVTHVSLLLLCFVSKPISICDIVMQDVHWQQGQTKGILYLGTRWCSADSHKWPF